MKKFKVTDKAMRPASKLRACFYCNQPIGSFHEADCVLISKKATVRFSIEYDISVPAYWTKEDLEEHRNWGSWCMGNALSEITRQHGECLCGKGRIDCLSIHDEIFCEES